MIGDPARRRAIVEAEAAVVRQLAFSDETPSERAAAEILRLIRDSQLR